MGSPELPTEIPAAPPAAAEKFDSGEQVSSHLESRGITVEPAVASKVPSVLPKITPRDLDGLLATDSLAAVEGERQTTFRALEGGGFQFDTKITRPGQKKADVQVTHSVHERDGQPVVHFDYVALPPELQGKGLGKAILAEQLAAYQRLGVSALELDARWIGRYYWPKVGFDVPPALLEELIAEFGAFLSEGGYSDDAVSAMLADVESLRDIATTVAGSRQVGKEFLLSGRAEIEGLSLPLRGKPLAILKGDLAR